MQQSGEVPEPEHPAAQPSPVLPPPPRGDGTGPARAAMGGAPGGRGFLVAGVLALVVVIGTLAWTARPDDGIAEVDRNEQRFPTPTTQPPPTTVPVATTVAPTPAPGPATPVPTPEVPAPTAEGPAPTAAPSATPGTAAAPASSGAPTTATAGLPPGTSPPGASTIPVPPDDPDYVASLVPSLAASTEHLATPELVAAQVELLLATPRHDVAVPGPTASICAVVPMDRPLAVRGRWERDGRRIASTDLERRDAPGFGECLADDGAPLEDGSYQFIAADSEGVESAAGGLVVGATPVVQRFGNEGPDEICAVRIAPSTSRYFEVYLFAAAPIAAGATIELTVADVEQDVETVGCDDEVLRSFTFRPDADAVQSLAP